MKKSFVLCLAIIMCLFAVTGSIAYFTDSIQSTGNVVASGNLKIVQAELERGTGNVLQPYTQNQAIYPSVGTLNHAETAAEYSYKVTDKEGNTSNHTMYAKLENGSLHGYVDKIVVVKNNGSLPTYVRTFVAVPASFDKDGAKALILDWNTADGWSAVAGPIEATITDAANKIENVAYNIYYVTNANAVQPGQSAPPSLLGFYLDSQVNHNGTEYTLNGKSLGSGSELKILVATQAAQVIPTGIGNDNQHMDAVDALTETYDVVSADGKTVTVYHPWMPAKTTD